VPTYEYACRDCGEHLEVVQSFKDDPLTTCPNCEGELRKVFSAAGIIFKGSGWHIKDYGTSSSGGSTSKADGASDTKSDSTSDSKSDEKSDATTSAKKDTKSSGTSTKAESA
jgi:putative FmdB family regulatory protein